MNRKTALAFVWILMSVWFSSMIRYASDFNGFWEVSLWSNILSLPFLLPTVPLFYKDLVKTPMHKYRGALLTTLLYTGGLLFSVRAFGENVGISTAIISLPISMVLVMALSFIKPDLLEKHTKKVYAIRLTSATVMFLAALGLST